MQLRNSVTNRKASRFITGFPYPSETLTSTRAGQWFLNGVAVSGEFGLTYIVPNSVGSLVRQGTSKSIAIINSATMLFPTSIWNDAAVWDDSLIWGYEA